MAGTHRSVSSFSWRPASRLLGALFAGSVVMFTAVAVQDGSLFTAEGEAGDVAGSPPDESATGPAPQTAAGPPEGSPLTAGDGAPLPGIGLRSEETVTEPSPTGAEAREVSPAPDAAADQSTGWAPGATRERDTSPGEVMVQRAPARTAPAPMLPAQSPPETGGTGQSDNDDNGVIKDLVGDLGGTANPSPTVRLTAGL